MWCGRVVEFKFRREGEEAAQEGMEECCFGREDWARHGVSFLHHERVSVGLHRKEGRQYGLSSTVKHKDFVFGVNFCWRDRRWCGDAVKCKYSFVDGHHVE